MNDNVYFCAAFIVTLLLTLWIGWYTIIVILVLSIILGVIYHKNEKKTKKYIGNGDAFASSVGIFAFGCVMVLICMFFKGCVLGLTEGPSYEKIERRTRIHTTDGDKMPTISEQGEYHNAGTGERQVEYGGSIEQKKDIEAADKLIENGY